ncbi:MAG: DUF819 family protein [Bacteroidetes bacterium]|nr:MAG: DUF819 family protein [Bacteroidota bacterium]
MNNLIAPDNDFAVLAVLLGICVFGILGERKKWFGNISGAVMVIFTGAILVTLNVLPAATDAEHPVGTYQFVFDYLIPLSIPLLIFNVNLRRIAAESGRLLVLFLIGSAGVVIGAMLASFLIHVGPETYKLAGVFVGTYTGGSVNFMAVAATFDFLESPLFSATMVVDNVFTNFFVMFLFTLPFLSFLKKYFPEYTESDDVPPPQNTPETVSGTVPKMEQTAVALTIAGLTCAVGFWLSGLLKTAFGIQLNIDLLVITALIVLIANLFPRQLAPYEATAFETGMLFMYLFLAVIGASCDLFEMLTVAPGVLFFALIILFVHLAMILVGGRLLKMSLREIVVASAANIGGPSIAGPIAGALNMKKSITPAILIGVLGYVIGTFLGVSVGLWVQ